MKTIKALAISLVAVAMWGLPLQQSQAAKPVSAEPAEVVLARINEISKDPARLQAAVEAGRERSTLCAHCHGVDGNSVRPEFPNLATQNPAYIVEQIGKFASGERKNFVMQTLAASFTLEDKVNLAIFFSNQSLKPIAADTVLAAKAATTFRNVCQLCHGENGRGEKGYARIAGQRPQYVINTLQRFRAAAQHKVDADDIQRSSARMEQVTQALSDQDIEALANYIALLR